jgi:antitoxin ParD1/3/4
MNVDLTPELEQLIRQKLQSGRYGSATEVVQEALRRMDESDQLVALRKDEIREQIAAGYDSLRRGEGVDGDAFFSALEQEEAQLRRKRG